MAESLQFLHVANRAVVRLNSWARPPTPAKSGGDDYISFSENHRSEKKLGARSEEGAGASLVPPGLGGQVRLLDVGPAEWLVVSDAIDGPTLQNRLDRHLNSRSLVAVDLSCGLKALRIEGRDARELLSKGCDLDLHPDSFPAGRVTRTRFAQLAVIVDCINLRSHFDLYVGRSYLAYLDSWLTDAAMEFQNAVS